MNIVTLEYRYLNVDSRSIYISALDHTGHLILIVTIKVTSKCINIVTFELFYTMVKLYFGTQALYLRLRTSDSYFCDNTM